MIINAIAIWTIGHSTGTIEEFIDMLGHNQIEIVVDVRHFPGSRRFPHFNKIAVRHSLVTAGIRYKHLVELGGRRPAGPARTTSPGAMPPSAATPTTWRPSQSAIALIAYWRSPRPVEPRSCVPKPSGGAATVR